jgi:hypothetical protein
MVLLGKRWIFFVGAVLGCLSFIAAIAPISGSEGRPGHDPMLANNLGFLFPPLVGLWAGWVRRSWRWAMAGSIIGFAIGGRYYLLCGHNFLAVMMAFPCLLGGAACLALGIGERSWRDRIIARYGKGLVAGLVLGSVCIVVLNMLGLSWLPLMLLSPSAQENHWMMWQSGPVAMNLPSGFYLVLFVWASVLNALSPKP